MFSWLKNFLQSEEGAETVKSFEEETGQFGNNIQYQKLGILSIPVEQIVGSVGRAHELDGNFRYRRRAVTSRYHNVAARVRQGQPMEPIKVLRIQHGEHPAEYYVVDGHHRVADAKANGFDEINAHVTDVILPVDDAS